MRGALIAAGLLLGGAGWLWWRGAQDAPGSIAPSEQGGGVLQTVENAGEWLGGVVSSLTGWNEAKIPGEYLAAIRDAEQTNGLPHNLLARLLWQESRYRADIISGKVKSSAGAIGIAQFMPATAKEWGIDPRNPYQSIAAAGKYLARLYARFGNWEEALAAYNWGQGNVSRKGLSRAPAETVAYYSEILADVRAA